MFSTISRFIANPFIRVRQKRYKSRLASSLEVPPVPPVESQNCQYGSYCIRVTVDSLDVNGNIDKSFIGYSQNMNITQKTEFACERYKRTGTKCQEPSLVFIGGNCQEEMYMIEDGKQIKIN